MEQKTKRIKTTLSKLAETAKKNGISSKKLEDAAPSYSLPSEIVTFSDVEIVVNTENPLMNHIALTAKDSSGLVEYKISVGRLQFSGIPTNEMTKEEAIEKIKLSKSNVYYLPGTRLNNWLQNDQVQACNQLIGKSFEVENIEMFTLEYSDGGYKSQPTVDNLVIKQVPKLTPVKVQTTPVQA